MWRRHSCLRVAGGDRSLRAPGSTTLAERRAALRAARRQECLRHIVAPSRQIHSFRDVYTMCECGYPASIDSARNPANPARVSRSSS